MLGRIWWASLALLMIGTVVIDIAQLGLKEKTYDLTPKAQMLLSRTVPELAQSLKFSPQEQTYHYNQDYKPGSEVAGQSVHPKFIGAFKKAASEGTTITDPVTQTSVTFKPQYNLGSPLQDQNRLVYPLDGRDGVKVYSLKSIGMKEDIILNKYHGDTLSFDYKLDLSEGTEARMESDGSMAVYGVQKELLGDVSTNTEKDAELLKKARQNAPKRTLLFTFPAPFVKEFGKRTTDAKAWFTLKGDMLTLHAGGLAKATYPLSIDPSVYIETAAKLMRGNNETNVDFDVDNELIQKSQTTGARIDEWQSTLNLNEGRWNHGVAVAGGYIYSVGGAKSNVVSQSYSTEGTDTFSVPSGVTSVTVKMWGAGGGGGAGGSLSDGGNGGGGGFTQATLSVTPLEDLTVRVGGAGGAGTPNSSSGDGGGGGGHSEVDRSGTPLIIAAGGGGGGGGDNSSGTAGGGGGPGGGTSGTAGSASSSAGGGGAGTAGAGGGGGSGGANGGSAGASETGGSGADGRNAAGADGGAANGGVATGGDGGNGDIAAGFAGGGGGGSGRFGGGGGSASASGNAGGGGGGGGSSYTTGTSVTNTSGSGANPGNLSDTDRTGAGEGGDGGGADASGTVGTTGKIIISYSTGVTANEVESSLFWAKFNPTTEAIESPNPGTGVCVDWCTSSVYDLPDERMGFSVVTYNGFLYVMGGVDSTGTRMNTVYIAKLGANGEPSRWHPTDTNKDNWVYWYSDTALSSAKSYSAAAAYNNRMYLLGGQTSASPGGVTTVEKADINPNGTLSGWTTTGMQALPDVRHGHTMHVYNDVMYLIGGNSNGTLRNTVYYSKLSTTGTMNSWVQANSFTTARSTWGGSYTTVWGAYLYLAGGCTAVNGSGYCTNIASDVQLASLNADGSISEWGSISNVQNQRIGGGLIAWQNGLYRIGGCTQQDTSTGDCTGVLSTVDYGIINPAGEVSTVNLSSPSGSGSCSGGAPHSCDLPPPGDDAGEGGQMLSMSAVMNGYLYVIGGCIDYDCNGTSPAGDDSDVTGNISYVAVDSSGRLTAPTTCSGTSVGAWCVDSTNKINNTGSNTTDGVAAGGVTTFGGRIYIVGGLTGNAISTNIYYIAPNANGSLPGAWSSVDMTTAGIAEDIAYTYAYSRANPASAGSNPGNLYVFGGCGNNTGGAGCGNNDYETEVYKCNITTAGSVSGCATSGQLQIDAELADETDQGLGIHSGTVYANYIYLIGGFSANVADRDTVFYAKFDNSNNVVSVTTSAAGGNNDDWIESTSNLSVGRRRGFSFGYNGHIYAVGGYDDSGTGIIPFIEWSKMNVSDGSIDPFQTSTVTINQRWGLSMAVSNSYAYVIGGCDVGTSPGGCSSFENSIQTFQLYNNESGAVNDFTAQSDDTFTANTDRWGASAAIHEGYLYVAGGCASATDCTDAVNNVQYAPISASDGTVGTWAAGGNLPADRAWGALEVVGGTLYYVGGQPDTATSEQSTVYYTTGISSGNPTWSGTAATNGLPAARTRFGSAVWNNRIYIVGGLDGSATPSAVVYVSPQLNSGGNITSAWSSTTSFNIARTGAAATAYANNLYLFGGFDGTNYLSDAQFAQINSDGTVDSWSYTTSLPGPLRDARAVSANGYIYLIGGRSAVATCAPNTLITPISANTTIATGNNPTGIGEWYETNVRYTGDRYGAAVAYDKGKLYTMGGGCTAPLAANRHYQSTVKSQPQVAKYSRMIDTDTDVFPNAWLMNGIDNSIGARWQVRYRSMHDLDALVNPNEDCGLTSTSPAMTTWGQDTEFGDVTLGRVETYTPRDGSGNSINCARYYYFFVSIDASKTFGYPEDVNRGPTISDLSLFFTSDPSKRLRHGKTFTGGEQQPLDTPCRVSGGGSENANCPLP
jgi:hypothetical protein